MGKDRERQVRDRMLYLEQVRESISLQVRYDMASRQHNFDRLVAQGVIMEGGLSERVTPQGGGECLSHNVPRHIY